MYFDALDQVRDSEKKAEKTETNCATKLKIVTTFVAETCP